MSGRRVRILLVTLLVLALAAVAIGFLWVPQQVSPYKLPWASGPANAHAVLQGNAAVGPAGGCVSGCGTHNDESMRYAWDFDLPEGTEVLAARGGTVALMNGSWRPDHCGGVTDFGEGQVTSPFIGNEANFVLIDHGDGTSALYLHLSTVSQGIERKARTGEPVAQGEVLGLSGKTGFTQCRPHLHFQVENSVRADWFTTSQPVSFADQDVVAREPTGVPAEGQTYVSDNVEVPQDAGATQ